eukprot:gene22273-26717_t
MSVEGNQVQFFAEKNCKGNPVQFFEGDSVTYSADHADNDKYMSCIIGSKVWLNAYQSSGVDQLLAGDQHLQLKTGTHNDLTPIKGLSKFQVLSTQHSFAIDLKFSDSTDKAKGYYTLSVLPTDEQHVTLFSGMDRTVQVPIGSGKPLTGEVNCQIIVREHSLPHSIVANGNIFFKYDCKTGI